MKEAAKGERCPNCGYASALEKNEQPLPDYKLRLSALRSGATAAHSVWVAKELVGTVEQFARKWRALDSTGVSIAAGEVSRDAALGKLLKHILLKKQAEQPVAAFEQAALKHVTINNPNHSHNPEGANVDTDYGFAVQQVARRLGLSVDEINAALDAAHANRNQAASAIVQFTPEEAKQFDAYTDDRAMGNAFGAAEAAQEQQAFASDPDYQSSMVQEQRAKDIYNEAALRYRELVDTGGIMGRSRLKGEMIAAAREVEKLTGINPMDWPTEKSGTKEGAELGWRKRKAGMAGETAAQQDARLDQRGEVIQQMDDRGWGEPQEPLQPGPFLRPNDPPWLKELLVTVRAKRDKAKKSHSVSEMQKRLVEAANKHSSNGLPAVVNRDLPTVSWDQLADQTTALTKSHAPERPKLDAWGRPVKR